MDIPNLCVKGKMASDRPILRSQVRKAPDLQLYLRRGAEVFESAVGAVGAASDTYRPAVVD